VERALIICGPTSSGKSEIALALAAQMRGEIVNADSRQVYRGMDIGTGMPPRSAFDLVPHHLYGFVDPSQRYSAARYVLDADAAIAAICARGGLPIVVGGTGFYIEALMGTMTLDRPPGDDALPTTHCASGCAPRRAFIRQRCYGSGFRRCSPRSRSVPSPGTRTESCERSRAS
jgi:tRNA dimethylallyltransferase